MHKAFEYEACDWQSVFKHLAVTASQFYRCGTAMWG